MKNEYNTRQKSIILNYLKENQGHNTASEIISALHKRGEKIGTATIYRQLEKLVSRGIVKKYITNNGACFQYSCECKREHFHLKCLGCDTLFHVDCDFLKGLSPHILEHHGFFVDNHRTVMFGLCEECREEKR